MTLDDVKDMTWAEFQLRSFSYWEDYENKILIEAKTAHKIYCLQFMFGKKKPEPFHQYVEKEYGIKIKRNKAIHDEKVNIMKRAWEEYEKQKDG